MLTVLVGSCACIPRYVDMYILWIYSILSFFYYTLYSPYFCIFINLLLFIIIHTSPFFFGNLGSENCEETLKKRI